MFHRFECKIAGRWSGFLCDFTSHIISLAWESDGWDREFGDEFYFLPSFCINIYRNRYGTVIIQTKNQKRGLQRKVMNASKTILSEFCGCINLQGYR